MVKLAKPVSIAAIAVLVLLVFALRLALAIATFIPATSPTGFTAQDEITNYNLTSGHEILYRGQYEKEYWGGNLIAYAVNSAGDIGAATQPWNGGAAYQLDVQGANRRIVTLTSSGSKIPFQWASLDASQQAALTSSSVLDYLRGVRSGEVQQGGSYRQRASALGDIVHSRPYYVSDAGSGSPAPTVFVGANDGMLHAFDAVTGAERWAYVPSMLIGKMKNLSVAPYVHDYYVDGAINIASILSGAKRILVGALGAGGKGLYALDITGSARLAPATQAAAADNILWEITPTAINSAGASSASSAYANLGYSYANPSIAKVSGIDAVVVGNGYNNGGDYQAYLFVINADTGSLIAAIQAGSSGTAGSPNGLSTPVAIDSNNDGNVDTVYAGDLNGTLWKFDLSSVTATALLTTSPAQPITMTPSVAKHPDGGYMVNFATGAMYSAADMTDSSTFAAYGIWDGAPAANTALLAQTLTERCYTAGVSAAASPCASRVRTVTSNQPDWSAWSSGAAHHKGWRVALPAGEKVVGDGSFIENGRFYFTGYNPNISTTVQASTVKGENWLMELNYLTGGSSDLPFLDLNSDHALTDDDRVKDAATPPAPVMTSDGIPVGKLLGIGVMSQPILVQLSTLNNTLFNQNPDVTLVPVDLGAGVTGGHFDEDIYYGTPSGGAQASATITVGSTGQTSGVPATLGAISVDGATILSGLSVADIVDGANSSSNATTIKNLVAGGFTATVSGNVVTIKAPLGARYNGKSIVVGAGTSQTPQTAAVPATAATKAVGSVSFTYASSGTSKNVTALTIVANGETLYSGAPGNYKPKNLDDFLDGKSSAHYVISKDYGNDHTIKISAKNSGAAWNGAVTVTISTSGSSPGFTSANLTGGADASAGTAASGWTDFAPALTASAFNSAGVEAVSVGDSCTGSSCQSKQHFHQYDDNFDVTGVNMLNPSSTTLDIAGGIPSLTQNFKVLAQNQYLNPAVKLHIGDPSYVYNIDYGYLALKNYVTSATLDLANLQTYRRDPNTVWPGGAVTDAEKLAQPKYIGSLAINMPLDALTAKNWWGNGDVRVGLHPTVTGCVKKAAGANDGNMYQPVIPPASGVDGPGVLGYSGSTTAATATGVRHNGALVIQIISDLTPNSALELSVPGRPEYGWRVKSSLYSTYVLTEYTTFWHHPNGKCYGDTGWTKTPAADNGSSSLQTKAPGSTDPHIGDLSASGGGGGTITSITTTVVGAVTTTIITYSDGTQASIVRTANADGTVTIVTTDALGVVTTQTIANTEGSLKTGGDERAHQAARTGRISWRELVAP